jgi:hypothetical protein
MADTKHAPAPVEGDGVSYSGIVWFVVILAGTTIVCQVLMIVLLNAMMSQAPDRATMASPLQPAASAREQETGRIYPGMISIGRDNGPAPRLLVHEPQNLDAFRKHETEVLTTYGWVDRNTGAIRMPIDRAKDLLLERGLATRAATPMESKDVKTVKGVK